MSSRTRNVAVIGLGTFGQSVARELTKMGDSVLGIDSKEVNVIAASDDLARTLQADATDPKALAECGLDAYDAVVVSIGSDLEASILAAMNVIELECPAVWVKAQNETQQKILNAIGVKNVVLPEQAYGASVAEIIHNPLVKDFLSFRDDKFLVQVSATCSVIESLSQHPDLLKNHHVRCIGAYHGGELIKPDAINELADEHATLLLFGERKNLRRFADELS